MTVDHADLDHANSQDGPLFDAKELRREADQGNPHAQSELGLRYALGAGVSRDAVEGLKWLDLAAAQLSGSSRVSVLRKRGAVAERLTAEQIIEAQRRAREWTPAPER